LKTAEVKNKVRYKMLYKAKVNEDEGVFKAPKTSKEVLGYELTQEFFVDNSGFGAKGESALTAGQFLQKVRQGFYYGITGAGQFQVYIGEFKKVNRKKQYDNIGILSSKKVKNNTRLTEYKDGRKVLTLHQTDIITWTTDGKIILNNGGYDTRTTRQRFNEFLGVDFCIYRKNSKTWIYDKRNGDITLEFFNGIELPI
jgi:hypothetical protein